jgi:hypothetical protein
LLYLPFTEHASHFWEHNAELLAVRMLVTSDVIIGNSL